MPIFPVDIVSKRLKSGGGVLLNPADFRDFQL